MENIIFNLIDAGRYRLDGGRDVWRGAPKPCGSANNPPRTIKNRIFYGAEYRFADWRWPDYFNRHRLAATSSAKNSLKFMVWITASIRSLNRWRRIMCSRRTSTDVYSKPICILTTWAGASYYNSAEELKTHFSQRRSLRAKAPTAMGQKRDLKRTAPVYLREKYSTP